MERLPEFDALRDSARAIKDHTLAHLDLYLEAYERKVSESGGHVHYARDAAEANAIVLGLCRERGAKAVTKGKSMISEEIGLNAALEAAGIEAIETDLGEYIIQLRGEAPSHIIAPAIHVSRDDVEADFRRAHRDLPATRDLSQPEQLLGEARAILRDKFLSADVGVTGANFLVAETGSSIIVTNEGNGDLTQILPKVHVVVASLEKIVPTLDDAAQLLRVLARSATGQDMSVYTTLSTGPRRPGDPDGPEEYHVVLLDNGRSAMLGERVRGHAALHPLRRLHEPLPGLSRDRRPRLWLGLSRPDGRGADAFADRRRRGRPVAQRLDLLRALRRSLPDAHSAAQDDAPLARARVRASSLARRGALRPRRLGVLRQAPGALPPFDRSHDARDASYRPRARALLVAAVRRRLDAIPRPDGAAGCDLSKPLAGQKRERAMSARDEILGAVRRSLHVAGNEAPRRAAVEARLAQAPAGVIPERGQGDARRRAATFKDEAARAQASLAEVADAADVPAEVARYLRENNLAATLRMGEDARLTAMPWGATALELSRGPSDGHDLNAVSAAFAAVAETGTLALVSGPDNPTTLNFLPDNHIVVVFADDLRRRYRERLRQTARRLRRRRRAAHAQFHHRPVALGRHRADAAPGRARPAAAAHRRRRRAQ